MIIQLPTVRKQMEAASSDSEVWPSSDLWDTDKLLFPGLHFQQDTSCTVCSVDHPAHLLSGAWPSCRLACRCDLMHPPITSHSPIFVNFKNRTGWKKTVSQAIFILSWKLIIIKFGELCELFKMCFCCRLVIDVEDPGAEVKQVKCGDADWAARMCTACQGPYRVSTYITSFPNPVQFEIR